MVGCKWTDCDNRVKLCSTAIEVELPTVTELGNNDEREFENSNDDNGDDYDDNILDKEYTLKTQVYDDDN